MGTPYERDVVAWANEQAGLIRARRFDLLDITHLADEIEDVGKSEQRELSNRMALLLAHLLKWQFQPERRGTGWERTIKEQRRGVRRRLERTPSLKAMLADDAWWADVWSDAVAHAASKTGLGGFPEACPWSDAEVLDDGWLPS